MGKVMKGIELQPGMHYQAVNEAEMALIKLLLEDSMALQQLKPSKKTAQNIRIAESMLNNRVAVVNGYEKCKKLCEQNC